MKNIKNILLVSFAGFALTACSGESHDSAHDDHDHDNACDDHDDGDDHDNACDDDGGDGDA